VNYKFLISLIVVLTFTISTLYAQSSKKDVKGFVVEASSGEALPYANISVRGTKQGTTTDKDGYFILVDTPIETDTLDVYYIGYSTQTVILSRQIKGKALLIKMKSNLLDTETITVTAEEYQVWKKSDEVSKITFSPKQIRILPNIGEADIFRSLQLLPGISGVSDGSAGLYVRGGTPDQNLVLLDGMTIYHVDHFFGFFSAFNADFIKDVQVYKGGFPAMYGGRLSSVVDLTGKTGNINDTKFSAGVNLISANFLYEKPLWNKGSFILSARRSYSDVVQTGLYESIFDNLSNSSVEPQQGSGRGRFAQQETVYPVHYFYDINSKLTYTLGNSDVLSMSFYSGRDNLDNSRELGGLNFKATDNEDAFGTRSNVEITDWGTIGSSLNWSRHWNDRLNSTAILAASRYSSEYSRHQEYSDGADGSGTNDSSFVMRGFGFANDEFNQIDNFTFKLDNEWYLAANHRLGFGTEVSQVATEYNASLNDTTSLFARNNDALQAALYVQDRWQLLDNLDLNLGLRATYYNKSNTPYIEPRISATYKLNPLISIKSAWGQYYQFIHQVTNEEIMEGSRDFWLVADEDFKPGYAQHFISGISYETNDYLFELEAYYKEMDNLIEYSRRFRDRANYGGLFFFGEGIAKGIELLAQKKAGVFNGWASYTLSRTEHTFPNLNDGESFAAIHDRTHEVKLVGTYNYKNWNFSSTWMFASGQPYTMPESQYFLEMLDGESYSYIHVSDKNANRLPDYHRLDLSISRLFYPLDNWDKRKKNSWHGEMGLSVFNVYNNDNVWYREYDLNVTPVLITDVNMLGITPTVFFKLSF